MLTERQQRQVDRFLDEAEAALAAHDWPRARVAAEAVLALDPSNVDGIAFLTVVDRAVQVGAASAGSATASASDDAPGEPGGAETSAPVAAPPASPTSFANGRYTVKRFLGEGGKKRVYLAHDTKLDRDVAFALIKSEGLDIEGLARIRREAQAMGRLGDHPHIVSVFDIGEEGGQPYIVTQLMGGGDVEGLIANPEGHRVPIEHALRIADQVCQALAHAHAHGVVHRDLKPGNVWLSADPSTSSEPALSSSKGQAIAKLGDFSLALALDRSRLTQVGMMVGTGWCSANQASSKPSGSVSSICSSSSWKACASGTHGRAWL